MRTYYRSFAGGELSPEMYGRIDDAKFQSGAAKVQNFVITPTGTAKNRAGFAFVKATKNNGPARLIGFTYSLNQTMVIELGNGYARFHTQGATLQYNVSQREYIPQSAVTFSVANPTVVTWTANQLLQGDLISFGTVAHGDRVPTGIDPNVFYSVQFLAANTFEIKDPTTGNLVAVTDAGAGTIYAIKEYVPGELCSYSGSFYYCFAEFAETPSIPSNPSAQPANFSLLPSDLTYEIPTPYQAADLFGIHYAQSADVMTLVHPNYPPAELSRLGATEWVLSTIDFGPPLSTPQSVAVAASPGFLAQIASITTADPALITTVSNHTLALGDGIYIANLTATIGGSPTVMDGFYMVDSVPVDGDGNLINDELTVMDYSGNVLDSSGWSSYAATDPSLPITIQYGTKIFNITSFYEVQAIASDGVTTSALSSSGANVLNNLDVPGSYNTITWAAVPNAQSYNVYKQLNGLWGYIGNTQALTFADNNIAPDMSITPGTPDAVFSGAGNYPGAVCYFQQRRCFGGTTNAPNNAWMSNSGTESMFSYSLPSLDTDRVAFRVAALQADVIQHMVPMLQLIMLTSESEFAVVPVNSQAITPTSVSVDPQSYIGASGVQPTIINTTMVYAAARGGHVREMGYAWTVNGYMTGDLSLRAAHLFDTLTIVDQAYSKSPWPIVWFVSSSGQLLGLTYIPEEQLGAWHEHVTEGTFQSIACVAEGTEDVLYAVITRIIDGQTVNYVERMQSRFFTELADAFFVDAGSTFDAQDGVTADTTVTLSPTTRPGPGGGVTDWFDVGIASSKSIFVYPTQSDVGSLIIVQDSSGNKYRIRILSTSSTEEASGLVLDVLPVEFTGPATHPPISAWEWARLTISGLTWLEGAMVAVLADGAVQSPKTVTGGAITLDQPATIAQIGLPYTCDLETLPAVLQLDGYGQGRMKNINRAWVKVYQSSGIFVGPDCDHLTEIKTRTTEPYGSPPALKSTELMVLTTPSWQTSGQTLIRQQEPLPLDVVGLTLEVVIGG
jgi:hypothetical protein